jgi:hypothetical protein
MDGLRSKSWQEFAQAGAPPLDFGFIICDDAIGEVSPVWPGKSMTARLLVLCGLTGVGVMAGWWYPSQQYATGGWR